tara:strand:+ start:1736 stop:2092 length:357 start_codon:yes stop_codon:yes gene_type:complete
MSKYIREFQACSFSSRKGDSTRLIEKYPDRCCIIVGKNDNSDVQDIPKHKFLVPRGLTMSQFQYVIRKKISCRPEQGIFIFVNNKLTANNVTVGSIYEENKHDDGFLYVIYSGENTFG